MSSHIPQFSIREFAPLNLPFKSELAAFRDCGAQGIGLSWFAPPKGDRPALSQMAADLDASGLQPTLCWPSTISFLPLSNGVGPQDPEARTASMAGEVEFLSGLRPHGIGCVTGPVGNRSEGEARGIVVECLREVALVAKRHGLQLGIEPIHPSIAAEFSFISSVEDAVSLIEAAGCDNVGLIFDIWHLYGQPHLAADIERYVDMFTLVDVGDWREPTRSWCDRLLPGDGAASVASTLRALREAGYQGWYELEILSDDGTYGNDFPDSLWKWDTNQLLREGFERFMRCWRGVT